MFPQDFDFDFENSQSSNWFSGGHWNDGTMSDGDPFPELPEGLPPLTRDEEFITPPARPPSDPFQFTFHQRYDSQPNRMPPPRVEPDSIPATQPSTAPKTLSFSRRSHGPRQISGAVDQEFLKLALDPSVTFNPLQLGFIPQSVWTDSKDVKFGDLVTDFFQRKNNANTRFSHKLYNALRITASDPFYFDFIGVDWISDIVLRVDKRIFAQLLGIKTVDGSLFHRQGNFPSHGFVELTSAEAAELLNPADLMGVDFDVIRLLVHEERVFVRDATLEAIENCRWTAARQRT
jgi:hypothetical protein